MKKVLILCLLLCGCYKPLYMNDPYKPTKPENVEMRGRFEANMGLNLWNSGVSGASNDDIAVACPNSEQIAYIKDFSIGPFFFPDEQSAIDNARKQAASIGGDAASVYSLSNWWWILFTTTHTRSIVYKCNVGDGKRIISDKPMMRQQEKQRTVSKPKKRIINGNEVMYIPDSYVK